MIIFLGDIFSLYIALALTILFRFGRTADQPLIISHLVTFSMIFTAWIIVFFLFNLYELDAAKPTPRTVGRLLGAFAINTFLGISFFYIIPSFGITPKINLFLVVFASSALIIGWRRIFYFIFYNSFKKTFVFYSRSENLQSSKDDIRKDGYFGAYRGTFSDIKNFLSSKDRMPDVIIAPDELSADELYNLRNYPGELISTMSAYEKIFGKTPVSLMNEKKAYELLEKKHHQENVFMRTFEVFFAAAVLLVTLPFALVAMLAILIEDGRPVLIRQKRIGKNESLFTFYKFRSMKVLAPDGSAEVSGAAWAAESDPRITRVGRILRKLHIDEIPQMWNIIKGDTALVGPRAERPEFVELLKKEIPYYFLRHIVRPGFTGWAQIKYQKYARTVEDSKEKFEYDLFYIKNRSVALNIGIIVKTIQIIFTH